MEQHGQEAHDERDVPALDADEAELPSEGLLFRGPRYVAVVGLRGMSVDDMSLEKLRLPVSIA